MLPVGNLQVATPEDCVSLTANHVLFAVGDDPFEIGRNRDYQFRTGRGHWLIRQITSIFEVPIDRSAIASQISFQPGSL